MATTAMSFYFRTRDAARPASFAASARRSAIDSSSWIAWGAFLLGFVATVFLAPGTARDVIGFGIGIRLILAAVAAFFLAVLVFQRQMQLALKSAHYGEPDRLVTSGAFAWSRNPIYTAFLLPLATFCWYSPVAAILAIAVYIVAMNRVTIAGEERALAAKFGDIYGDYCRRTPRWLFRLWRSP